MSAVWSAWTLLAGLLGMRLLAPVRGMDAPWRARVDLPLAAACGLVFGWLTAVRLPDYHLAIWPLTGSDFFQYCESVGAVVRGKREAFWDQRSYVAAQLPALLARRHGILGGLALGAAWSQVLLGAALYLWGRAVHTRFAGVGTALLGATVAPLVILARTVSFYPESVAVCALCAAVAAGAVRWRTLGWIVAAGAGAGLALMTEVRGLTWGLVAVALAGVACFDAPRRRVPWRLVALAAPVAVSWGVAHAIVQPNTPGLTRQTEAFLGEVMDRLHRPHPPDRPYAVDFLWGRASPLEIPEGILAAARLVGEIPPDARTHPEVVAARMSYIDPWLWPTVGAAIVAVAGLVRRPWSLLALLGPLVPYLASARTAALVLTYPRYLSVAFAGLPVLLGVAVAVAGTRDGRGLPQRVRAPLGVLLLVGVVLGVVPSWLSPVAPWRIPQAAEQFPRELQLGNRVPNGTDRVCAGLLDEDTREGRTWEPYPPPP